MIRSNYIRRGVGSMHAHHDDGSMGTARFRLPQKMISVSIISRITIEKIRMVTS